MKTRFFIRRRDGRGDEGCGVLLAPNRLLTCAHVLHQGGYNLSDREQIDVRARSRGEEVRVQATLLGHPWFECKDPPREKDFVLLECSGLDDFDAPVVRTIGGHEAGSRFRVFGLSADARFGLTADLLLNEPDNRGLYQLNQAPSGYPVQKGFSGSPVFDKKGKAVGIVVTRRRDGPEQPVLAFALPFSLIAQVCARHEVDCGFELEAWFIDAYAQSAELRDWIFERRQEQARGQATRHLLQTRLVIPEGSRSRDHGSSCDQIEHIHLHGLDQEESSPSLTHASLADNGMKPPFDAFGKHRLLYIQAPGGAGKTFFLYALLLRCFDWGIIPFFMDAGDWREKAAKSRDERLDQLDSHLKHLKSGPFQKAERAGHPALLVIDGVNETTASVEGLYKLVEYIAGNFGNTAVILADRMTFRSRYPEGFRLATIAPLTRPEIEEALQRSAPDQARPIRPDQVSKSFSRILRIPFFLDILRSGSGGATASTRSDAIETYLEQIIFPGTNEGKDAQFNLLARFAFENYRDKGLSIVQEELDQAVGPGWTERLRGSGLLRKSQGRAFKFRHQLIHDYLAARHFSAAENEDEGLDWTPANFSTLTFQRQSYDSLAFFCEMLPGRSSRQDLLVRLYDWDYPAALRCILDLGEEEFDPDLVTAVYALVAEKRFERFLHSRRRVRPFETILSRLGIEQPPTSVEQLARQVSRIRRSGAWEDYEDWVALFATTRSSKRCPRSTVLNLLFEDDPLLGWTAANVLRRFELKPTTIEWLFRILPVLLKSESALLWRVVHILGTQKSDLVADSLTQIVWSPQASADARYGAARSLAEIAAGPASRQSQDDRERCRRILSAISKKLGELRDESMMLHCFGRPAENSDDLKSLTRVLSQFRKCAILQERRSQEPDRWQALYAPILKAGKRLFDQLDPKEADKWKSQIDRFRADERRESE